MIKPGQTAPAFTGLDQDGRELALSDYAGRKLVLYFYPKDDTPGCTAEACSLRDRHSQLESAGYEVLGVSPDGVAKHARFKAKHGLPFRLLADTDLSVAKAFGVWGRKKFMGREFDGIIRTTFLIDEKGIVERVIDKVLTKDHAAQVLATG
ncbi:MAG: thioredoxin-dependent thiol peroxidase [Flavobacteriales bacterium]|nr:thioredoxin-dependent thiol peroxidase [Flavobacteriales bacterium]